MFVLSGVALLIASLLHMMTGSPTRIICRPSVGMTLVGHPGSKSGCKGVQSTQNKHCYIRGGLFDGWEGAASLFCCGKDCSVNNGNK